MLKRLKKIGEKLIGSKLPGNNTCINCEKYVRCKNIYGKINDSRKCLWVPNSFVQNKEDDEIAFIVYLLYRGVHIDNIQDDIYKYLNNWNREKESNNKLIVDNCYNIARYVIKRMR